MRCVRCGSNGSISRDGHTSVSPSSPHAEAGFRPVADLDRPLTPGHEVIGNVAAVGPGEKQWKVGDRVGAGWHGGHDGKPTETPLSFSRPDGLTPLFSGMCKWCRKGFNQACVNKTINGIMRDGGCE